MPFVILVAIIPIMLAYDFQDKSQFLMTKASFDVGALS
jgi:hypothetical protein